MNSDTLIILLILVQAALILWLILRPRSNGGNIDQLARDIDIRLREQNQQLFENMYQSQTAIQQQFDTTQRILQSSAENSQKIIKEVTENLSKLQGTNSQIVEFASQLQSLERILKNPKQRGILGEYFLENVLKNVLPPSAFDLQHKFKNGTLVDAVIWTNDLGIPIDAKFSLENYNNYAAANSKEERVKFAKLFHQDIKKRVLETSKYISPENGTYEFAFMFIPADGVYYDLLTQKVISDQASLGVIEYAFEHRVIIVSPTTLFAYLQTVLQGLRALEIENSAKEIQQNVSALQKHFQTYTDSYRKIGYHMSNAVSAYNTSGQDIHRLEEDMINITKTGEKSKLELVAKPERT